MSKIDWLLPAPVLTAICLSVGIASAEPAAFLPGADLGGNDAIFTDFATDTGASLVARWENLSDDRSMTAIHRIGSINWNGQPVLTDLLGSVSFSLGETSAWRTDLLQRPDDLHSEILPDARAGLDIAEGELTITTPGSLVMIGVTLLALAYGAITRRNKIADFRFQLTRGKGQSGRLHGVGLPAGT